MHQGSRTGTCRKHFLNLFIFCYGIFQTYNIENSIVDPYIASFNNDQYTDG